MRLANARPVLFWRELMDLEAVMECEACNAILSPDARFCSACGARRAIVKTNRPAAPEKQTRSGLWLVLGGVFAVSLLGYFLGNTDAPVDTVSTFKVGAPEAVAVKTEAELEAEKQAAEDARLRRLKAQAVVDNLRRGRQWRAQEDVSPVDDSRNVYLTLSAKQTDRYKAYRMTVRCLENTTAVVFNFDDFLGDDDASVYTKTKRVTFRIDDDPSYTRSLSVSTNNESVGFWAGGEAIPFVKKVMTAKKLVVRLTPYSENPVTLEFDVEGLDNRISGLRDACSW